MKHPDIVIIGAGIIGLSIAWQLSRRGQNRVLVLEKGAGVGEGSTGASSAICRHRYSEFEMIRLAKAGIGHYRNWREFTGLTRPRADFVNDGVLWLTGDGAGWAKREQARLAQLGIRAEVLDDRALAAEFPALNPCLREVDLSTGEAHQCAGGGHHLFEVDAGYVDPVSAAQDLVEACRGAGVELRFNTRVSRVELSGGRTTGVLCADGERIVAERVVNAAGPWCNELYAASELEAPMPMQPVRIQVLHMDRTPALEGHIPICADLCSGIYFRTQNRGQQLLVGSVREEDDREAVADPDDFLRVADERFRLEKLHLLQHRLPKLELNRSLRDYCGLYTINLSDVHPVLGAYGPQGFFVANGFSGHGFKLAPAVGALLAIELTGTRLPGEEDLAGGWLSPQREPIAIAARTVLA